MEGGLEGCHSSNAAIEIHLQLVPQFHHVFVKVAVKVACITI